VLSKVSEQIADRLRRAEEAHQRGARETNEKIKAEWLEMEKRWLRIAESLQFVEQANQFLDGAVKVTPSKRKSQNGDTSSWF
jgi:pyruvate carboxylase